MIVYVKKELEGAEAGHDWFHIERVWNTAKHIVATESVDVFVVELGALLHDIADVKFTGGDETIGPKKAREILARLGVEEASIQHVEQIIRHVSFKGGAHEQLFTSPELSVVQDADRLDALGAIGIARAFTYGGHKHRVMWNPSDPPKLHMTKEAYYQNEGSSINHFYEKLLLLKDRMNTETGKRMAQRRHAYMEQFLEEFFAEWNGEI